MYEKSVKELHNKEIGSSVMDSEPLPETRDVLRGHLLTKVRYLNPALAEQITDKLIEDKTNNQIIELLVCDSTLEENVEKFLSCISVPNSEVRESLGMALYQAVSSVEHELCAQVTGMLLELPVSVISQLINDEAALKEAVTKARQEYIRFSQGEDGCQEASAMGVSQNISNEKEELGEVIFEKISKKHPQEAAKLTGMLLQMEYKDLVRVIAEPELLTKKVELALSVLRSYKGS
ncbi:uncharacterized protein [Macrobrachium rosenbergii]|uniref:uncharacterized protein isoform X1 n=2 Tax=Macrobrachium rosenbergii TaxID=79674 RepID=UPI0034D4CABE